MASNTPVVRVVTRADDAGSSRSANRAIREACRTGVCRNIGLMAPTAHIEDAADCFRDLKGVCFGMHATMNSEWDWPTWGPLCSATEVPHLYDARGVFPATPHRQRESDPAGAAPLEEMRREMEAQLDRLTRLGLPLTYLDEHMFFARDWWQWSNDVYAMVKAFAFEKGLIFDPPLRMMDLGRGKDLARLFLEKVASVAPGHYLMLGHPCYDDDETRSVRMTGEPEGFLGPAREAERLLFTDPRVVAAEAAGRFRAVRYDQLDAYE